MSFVLVKTKWQYISLFQTEISTNFFILRAILGEESRDLMLSVFTRVMYIPVKLILLTPNTICKGVYYQAILCTFSPTYSCYRMHQNYFVLTKNKHMNVPL